MARDLLATASLIRVYEEEMGFVHRAGENDRHEFSRGDTVLIHEAVRGAGFDTHFLMSNVERHGLLEEMEQTLQDLSDKLELVPYPPSSKMPQP